VFPVTNEKLQKDFVSGAALAIVQGRSYVVLRMFNRWTCVLHFVLVISTGTVYSAVHRCRETGRLKQELLGVNRAV
jgi:hypothetical protein